MFSILDKVIFQRHLYKMKLRGAHTDSAFILLLYRWYNCQLVLYDFSTNKILLHCQAS